MSDLEVKAQHASSVITPAELHGMVCGFAAGDPPDFSLTDFVQLASAESLSDEASVSNFVTASLEDFYSEELGFSPLIPSDAESLVVRLMGLAEWCAGFLSGFGASVSQHMNRDALHVDIQGILQDFASISGLDEEVDGDDQDESSFMEIFEYVRVAAVLTATLMNEARRADEVPKGEDREIEH